VVIEGKMELNEKWKTAATVNELLALAKEKEGGAITPMAFRRYVRRVASTEIPIDTTAIKNLLALRASKAMEIEAAYFAGVASAQAVDDAWVAAVADYEANPVTDAELAAVVMAGIDQARAFYADILREVVGANPFEVIEPPADPPIPG
jgi:hypothetical protein